MKVKELIEDLQRLDPNLYVYITNIEETQLTQIDVVIPCVDYGENANDEEEFAAIFPKANFQPSFSLSAEDVEVVRQALLTEKNVVIDIHCKYPAVDDYIIPTRDKINNLLTRIKQWQDETTD